MASLVAVTVSPYLPVTRGELVIARIWTGRVPLSRSDAYLQLMRTVALPDYGATPGNRGAFALRRDLADHAEFIMLTLWDSLEAIERFAGPDATTAKYYDFDPEYLLEMPGGAEHFEVYDR